MNHGVVLALLGALALSPSIVSAQSASELLEAARAQSKEIEELKAVMDGPDRNLRLAAFDAMVAGESSLYREIAVEAGLASTDSLLRARALAFAMRSASTLVINLAVDTAAPKSIQENSTKYLAEKRQLLTVSLSDGESSGSTLVRETRDDYSQGRGSLEVQGLQVQFTGYYNRITGELTLGDDGVLAGPLGTSDNHRFIGTTRLR
tara:strand:+ start:11612 stop:12229 length:618 start_codon:yes stop_codon:yes gene_type:complete